MNIKRKPPAGIPFTVPQLDLELIARGKPPPGARGFEFRDREGTPQRDAVMKQVKALYDSTKALPLNETIKHMDSWELVQLLIRETTELNHRRGTWYDDDRMDAYTITDTRIKRNADCVAAICPAEDLSDERNGFCSLRVKNYGVTFGLCDGEPFRMQPVAAGKLCTGFLVADDVLATAGHCANEENLAGLRVVFGYKMLGCATPVTRVPDTYVYKATELIHRVYDPYGNGADWALVKLDRKVEGQTIAKLSEKDLFCETPVYVLGHPLGLPLKYAPNAYVCGIEKTFFTADLDIYSGNSGSPVFNAETHEVIGIVVRGDNQDFRLTEKGWLSIRYPNREFSSNGAHCTRVSEFTQYYR